MRQKPDEATDIDVVRRVMAGDVNAFEILVNRYQAYVFTIVRKHVPFDNAAPVAHDVFVRAYRALPGYKQKSEFVKWLAGISVRTCADFWRRRYRRREVPISTLAEDHREWLENILADNSADGFRQAGHQAEAKEILSWGLNQLNAQDRMVLELVHLEGHSVKEAAELMGCSTANVKIRTFRARKKLQTLLTHQEEDSP